MGKSVSSSPLVREHRCQRPQLQFRLPEGAEDAGDKLESLEDNFRPLKKLYFELNQVKMCKYLCPGLPVGVGVDDDL